MRASQRLVRLLTILVLGGFILGVCLVALGPGVSKIAASAHYTGTVAPALRPLEGPTTLYDANGNVMDRLGDLDRTPVELNEVPKTLIYAVVATEDRTFFAQPRRRRAVELPRVPLQRRVGWDRAGRIDDHPAADQEPLLHQPEA